MLLPVGYRLVNTIYSGSKTAIFLAAREGTKGESTVILKTFAHTPQGANELRLLQREFELVKPFSGQPGILQYKGVESGADVHYLVMESSEGILLRTYLQLQVLDIETALTIAYRLAEVVDLIHQHRVLHRDIKPDNVLINVSTQAVFLIDFGLATRLLPTEQQLLGVQGLEGTLAYLAPEQTGRVQSPIDMRTDLYSLGVTLYEIFTGRLPFVQTDPLELVYAHLALAPTPPNVLKPDLPQIVSNILLKLLAKNPEDRYLSAAALAYDLKKCLSASGRQALFETDFILGEYQKPNYPELSQKITGRSAEIEQLTGTFEAVRKQGGVRVCRLAGPAGIGKTALVYEVLKTLTRYNGIFLSGKFDQLDISIPYAALIEAFNRLSLQLLSSSDEELAEWKKRLIQNIGDNLGVLTALIPELERLTGTCLPPPVLAPEAAKQRFKYVWIEFLRACARPTQPLVLFLDDVQWADPASRSLLRSILLAPELRQEVAFFLVLAHRNEQDYELEWLDQLEAEIPVIEFSRITLNPLSIESYTTLIAESLHQSPSLARTLAEILYEKTGGNPFFTGELIRSLAETHQLLQYIPGQGWQGDIAKIRAFPVAANVVELQLRRMGRFSPETTQALQIAAVLGHQVSLTTLAALLETTPDAVLVTLYAPIFEGMLRYQEPTLISEAQLRFTHDKIQQAAAESLPKAQRAPLHLKISAIQFRRHPDPSQPELLFNLLGHLNQGFTVTNWEAISGISVQQAVAMNLKAIDFALSSNAFEAADTYINAVETIAARYFWTPGWEKQTEIFYQKQSIVAFLTGNYALLDRVTEIAFAHLKDPLSTAHFYEMQLLAAFAKGDRPAAIEWGLRGLRTLGIDLKLHPGRLAVVRELLLTRWVLWGRSVDSLAGLAEMKDRRIKAIMWLMQLEGAVAYFVDRNLFAIIGFRMIRLAVRYGGSAVAASAFYVYAISQIVAFNNITAGLKYEKVGRRLIQRFPDTTIELRMQAIRNVFFWHREKPLREFCYQMPDLIPVLRSAGNLEFAAMTGFAYVNMLLFSGKTLPEIQEQAEAIINKIAHLRQETYTALTRLALQTVRLLRGIDRFEIGINGPVFREIENEQGIIPAGRMLGFRAMLSAIYRHFEDYFRVDTFFTQIEGIAGTYTAFITAFYQGIVYLQNTHKNKQYLKRGIQIARYYQRCAQFSPANHLGRALLLQALVQAAKKRYTAARNYFIQSENLLRQQGLLAELALCAELRGRLEQQLSGTTAALPDFRLAYFTYIQWGAETKAAALLQEFPELKSNQPQPPTELNPIKQRTPTTHIPGHLSVTTNLNDASISSGWLDMLSLIRASQSLSSEIQPLKLINRLLELLLENSGATNCQFLSYENQKSGRRYAVWQDTDGCIIFEAPEKPPVATEIPFALCNFAAHTHKPVIFPVTDPNLPDFETDPYFQGRKIRSALCLPIINRNLLIGIVYLESDRTDNLFTTENIATLQILAAQAAISLENAAVYATLEARVQARTNELETALSELKAAQQRIVATEKMASLGKLVSNIAHELNSPMGAIRAAAQNMLDMLPGIFGQLPEAGKSIYSKKQPLFMDLLSRAMLTQPIENFQESRTLRRKLRQELTKLNIANPDDWAARFVTLNLAAEYQLYLPLLEQVDSQALVELAYQVGVVISSLRNILEAEARTNKIVHTLKSISGQGLGGEITRIELCRTLNIALEELPNQLKNNIKVEKNYTCDHYIAVNPNEMVLVWSNLFQNSLQAMENGGTLRINVHQVPFENWVEVQIQDTGKGIPPENLPRIFEPFYTTRKEGEGSGLGLYLSRSVIEKYNGTISVTSEPQNTCVTVRFPIVNVELGINKN